MEQKKKEKGGQGEEEEPLSAPLGPCTLSFSIPAFVEAHFHQQTASDSAPTGWPQPFPGCPCPVLPPCQSRSCPCLCHTSVPAAYRLSHSAGSRAGLCPHTWACSVPSRPSHQTCRMRCPRPLLTCCHPWEQHVTEWLPLLLHPQPPSLVLPTRDLHECRVYVFSTAPGL